MSEPLWCEVRQHYCRCHDFGKRCDDYFPEHGEVMRAFHEPLILVAHIPQVKAE